MITLVLMCRVDKERMDICLGKVTMPSLAFNQMGNTFSEHIGPLNEIDCMLRVLRDYPFDLIERSEIKKIV